MHTYRAAYVPANPTTSRWTILLTAVTNPSAWLSRGNRADSSEPTDELHPGYVGPGAWEDFGYRFQ
jgi:hypothetical protein